MSQSDFDANTIVLVCLTWHHHKMAWVWEVTTLASPIELESQDFAEPESSIEWWVLTDNWMMIEAWLAANMYIDSMIFEIILCPKQVTCCLSSDLTVLLALSSWEFTSTNLQEIVLQLGNKTKEKKEQATLIWPFSWHNAFLLFWVEKACFILGAALCSETHLNKYENLGWMLKS